MALHFLSSVAFIAGAILFILWANKHLDKKHLKKLITTLLVVGIIGAVITGGSKGKWGHKGKELSAEKKVMILEVLENNDVDMTEEQLDAVLAELKEKKKGMKGKRRGRW